MTIVWSGRGFLSIIVFFAVFFLSASVLPKELSNYTFICSAFISGLFSWYFGKKWNSEDEKIVIDEKTGQKLILKNTHELFWIPLQYWGLIFSGFGLTSDICTGIETG